jgi:hypothetical protein
MTELLHSAAQKIVDDPAFLKIIETKMTEIMADGKITTRDIPDIILLVVQCTNNLSKFNLTYEELGEALEETINYLLDHFKVIPENDKDDFRAMVKTIVTLVMLQPKVKSCLLGCMNKLCCKK